MNVAERISLPPLLHSGWPVGGHKPCAPTSAASGGGCRHWVNDRPPPATAATPAHRAGAGELELLHLQKLGNTSWA